MKSLLRRLKIWLYRMIAMMTMRAMPHCCPANGAPTPKSARPIKAMVGPIVTGPMNRLIFPMMPV